MPMYEVKNPIFGRRVLISCANRARAVRYIADACAVERIEGMELARAARESGTFIAAVPGEPGQTRGADPAASTGIDTAAVLGALGLRVRTVDVDPAATATNEADAGSRVA